MDTTTTRAKLTSDEWLRVGKHIGEMANEWANRNDLVAYVGAGAGNGAPASYSPALAEVELDVDLAFGKNVKAESIGDLRKRKNQYEFPKAVGAILHEAFHARFTTFDLKKAAEHFGEDVRAHKIFIVLEESRCESYGMEKVEKSKIFLRAVVSSLILDDLPKALENLTTDIMSNTVGLVISRIDAGIIDEKDCGKVMEIAKEFFGEEVLEELRSLATTYRECDAHSRPDIVRYGVATKWREIIDAVSKEKGDFPENQSEETSKQMKMIADALNEALEEMSNNISISNQKELNDKEDSEDLKEAVESKNSEAKDRKSAKDTAKDVFNKLSGPLRAKTKSSLIGVRKPSDEERAGAILISKMLEKAKYRERDQTEVSTELPPGRLRTRAMVQVNAQRQRGVFQKSEPWRRTMRKTTDDPTLRVGVMVDISASMRRAMEPMATTAWVMSEAVRRVQGKSAMVYYGNDVFYTLKPNQHLDEVRTYSATDGTEEFEKAFLALDGSLDLLHGNGARLLVVVSDGCYREEQTTKAIDLLSKCEKNGVAVLWLTFDHGVGFASILAKGKNVAFLPGVLDPAKAASEIGKAAASVLSRIGARV
jgi:hypothetical protein